MLALIDPLNADAGIHGILAQLPLPAHAPHTVLERLSPEKDVDGLHPQILGACLRACALRAMHACWMMEMLKSIGLDLRGKEAVVVG